MKKFIATAIAAAAVIGMATVSFASATINTVADIGLRGPYRYDDDDNTMSAPGENYEALRYGEGTYYLIITDDKDDSDDLDIDRNGAAITSYKQIEKLKTKVEFQEGEDIVESVSIVKKYVDADAVYIASDGLSTAYNIGYYLVTDRKVRGNGALVQYDTKSGYYYFVEFMVKDKETTNDADIVGTITFNRKADKDVKSWAYSEVSSDSSGVHEYSLIESLGIGKIDDKIIDFNFNVFYKDTYINSANRTDLLVKDDLDLKYNTAYVLKFDCDDEVEFSFGDKDNDGTNEGSFTVDVSGQGKIYLYFNTDANDKIVSANQGANIKFINFNDVRFSRAGEFVYEMDGVVAAYRIVDGKLVPINGVEITNGEVKFTTNMLGSYVFADRELTDYDGFGEISLSQF